MKYIIFFSLIILFTYQSSFSQHIKESKVPISVKDSFNAQFPTASDIKWGKENASEYEADFILNDTQMSANFTEDGKWLETETSIDKSALPQNVVDAVIKDYPAAKIYAASKIEKADKSIIYEADIKIGKKKIEVTYDGNGNPAN